MRREAEEESLYGRGGVSVEDCLTPRELLEALDMCHHHSEVGREGVAFTLQLTSPAVHSCSAGVDNPASLSCLSAQWAGWLDIPASHRIRKPKMGARRGAQRMLQHGAS